MITTYEQAKRLKELGYRHYVLSYYDEYGELTPCSAFDSECRITMNDIEEDCNASKWNILAPSVSEALQWMRDNHTVCWVQFEYCDGINWYGTYMNKEEGMSPCHTDCFESYPEAESALLDELLTYIEQKR